MKLLVDERLGIADDTVRHLPCRACPHRPTRGRSRTFGDPDHASAARSDTFLYVLATSTSIDSGAGAVFSNPLLPLTPLVFACWLCSVRIFPALSRPYAHRLNFHRSRVRTQDLRRSCGRSADAELGRHASLLLQCGLAACCDRPLPFSASARSAATCCRICTCRF